MPLRSSKYSYRIRFFSDRFKVGLFVLFSKIFLNIISFGYPNLNHSVALNPEVDAAKHIHLTESEKLIFQTKDDSVSILSRQCSKRSLLSPAQLRLTANQSQVREQMKRKMFPCSALHITPATCQDLFQILLNFLRKKHRPQQQAPAENVIGPTSPGDKWHTGSEFDYRSSTVPSFYSSY